MTTIEDFIKDLRDRAAALTAGAKSDLVEGHVAAHILRVRAKDHEQIASRLEHFVLDNA